MIPSFLLQNINRTFLPTWKTINILDVTSFLVCLLLNTLFTPAFCSFWGFLLLILRFSTLNIYTLPSLFVDRVQKWSYYLSLRTSISKNTSGTLYVGCLFRNLLFILLLHILFSKCLNHSYLWSVYTINTPRTTNFFSYNGQQRKISLLQSRLAFKSSVIRFFWPRNNWICCAVPSLLFNSFQIRYCRSVLKLKL